MDWSSRCRNKSEARWATHGFCAALATLRWATSAARCLPSMNVCPRDCSWVQCSGSQCASRRQGQRKSEMKGDSVPTDRQARTPRGRPRGGGESSGNARLPLCLPMRMGEAGEQRQVRPAVGIKGGATTHGGRPHVSTRVVCPETATITHVTLCDRAPRFF